MSIAQNVNRAELATNRAFNSINPQDLLTATPGGWYTVASWWSLKETGALGLLYDPLATFHEDDAHLQERCAAGGWPVVWVAACPAFTANGLKQERAYPAKLLSEFYPVNP